MGEIGVFRNESLPLPPVFDDLVRLVGLPKEAERWPLSAAHSGAGRQESAASVRASLRAAETHGAWQWPSEPVVFLSDTHADCESFLRSLTAAGVIRRDGTGPGEFHLTAFGRRARIVIGGDCLDKGPSNLDMLDGLAALIGTGAEIHLLAGNHDLRLRLAIRGLTGPRSVLTEHLFLRMGRKILPLLREIRDRLLPSDRLAALPNEAECRRRLLPSPGWSTAFPDAAASLLSDVAIASEMRKMRRKAERFDADIEEAGLTMREAYAAALHCERLFLAPDGSFGWFFLRMDAICRIGSLLFVHAGVDDEICALLARGGASAVNRRFREEDRLHPLAFYFGSVANLARTKYRESDKRLTGQGVATLHGLGIKMVVQGHVNNHAGQRLLVKNGLLHLEGDVTLDRTSRQLEGLTGVGCGATLIFPSGDVVGVSSDYPRAKHFHPERHDWEAENA